MSKLSNNRFLDHIHYTKKQQASLRALDRRTPGYTQLMEMAKQASSKEDVQDLVEKMMNRLQVDTHALENAVWLTMAKWDYAEWEIAEDAEEYFNAIEQMQIADAFLSKLNVDTPMPKKERSDGLQAALNYGVKKGWIEEVAA